MRVELHRNETSRPVVYEEVKNTYTKGGMFCLMFEGGRVDKYPLVTLFRVTERNH